MSYVGISGLNMARACLEAAGHNIANGETGGFKQFRVLLSDNYTQPGSAHTHLAGVNVDGNEQMFSQGALRLTGNSFDMALSGGGFFVLAPSTGGQLFSRAGFFHMDKDGRLVNPQGHRLQGFSSHGRLADMETGPSFVAGSPSSKASVVFNLDSRTDVSSTASKSADAKADASESADAKVDASESADAKADPSESADAKADPSESADAKADPPPAPSGPADWEAFVTVYDSLGSRHDVLLGFTKTDVNAWQMQAALGETPVGDPVDLAFDPADGSLKDAQPVTLELDDKMLGTGAESLKVELALAGSTQHADGFAVDHFQQDGCGFGNLNKVVVGNEGWLQALYSNGDKKTLGQVAVATFHCEQGLRVMGENNWLASRDSGDPVFSVSGRGGAGVVHGGMVEQSNVEVASELLNLLVAQRNYQVNARTIKAEETMNQTLLNHQI